MVAVPIIIVAEKLFEAALWVTALLAAGTVVEKAIDAAKESEDVFDPKEPSGCVICGTSSDKTTASTVYNNESTEEKEGNESAEETEDATDNSEEQQGNESDKCKRIRQKIENLRREIYDKRYPDLENNPGELPPYIGPGEKRRNTVRGHEKLLNEQLRRLRNFEDRYDKECSS